MKNKKNIYFLLPAVLIIWGVIGYRIFASIGPKDKTVKQVALVDKFNPTPLAEQETYTLNLDYRDPFLGSLYQKKKRTKPRKAVPKKAAVPFPKIEYKGRITGEGKDVVYLIKINDKQHFFKRNATKEEVKLLRGNAKQVKLKFQDQTQTFLIQK